MQQAYQLTAGLIGDINHKIRLVQHNDKALREIGKVLHERIGPPGPVPVPYQLALMPINELDEMHEVVQEIVRKHLTS